MNAPLDTFVSPLLRRHTRERLDALRDRRVRALGAHAGRGLLGAS